MENPEVKQQNCCKKKSWRSNAVEKVVIFGFGCLTTYCCLNPNKVKNQLDKVKGYFQKGQKGGEQ